MKYLYEKRKSGMFNTSFKVAQHIYIIFCQNNQLHQTLSHVYKKKTFAYASTRIQIELKFSMHYFQNFKLRLLSSTALLK